ncbi:MAG: DUF1538 domain-containing protein [Thermoanaerobaculia bacterium]|nr:DUF1538 domain-containing protein [Thermoanaerobaculia bacterium]
MEKRIRFGDYAQEIRVRQRKVSYNWLVPRVEKDADGSDLPHRPSRLELRSLDVVRLVRPYVSVRLADQMKAVVPLALYLFLFQLLILRRYVENSWQIVGGLLAVILGLMLFMEGLRVGLMPFGETIGNRLPRRSPLPVVLLIAFLLGIGVTFAEPAIGALQTAGSVVDVEKAPYLYALLNEWAGALVLIVGAGVGLAAVLGTMRFLNGWSLKPLIFAVLIPTVLLTVWAMVDPSLSNILGLAWDCGAVTTGPVTVPLVLSLGVGIASAAGKGHSSLSGFGIVTLASLFPVLGVLCLGLFVTMTVGVEEIVSSAGLAAARAEAAPWYAATPWNEILLGIRAIVPLILFLLAILYFIVRDRVRDRLQTTYGLTIVVVGMIIFNLGLTYGLSALGGQSGALVPAAFTSLPGVEDSPLYAAAIGITIAILFAWFLGFGATLAEPALNALGLTVEDLTNGAFRKSMLMNAVSIGVGFGLGLGVVKIIFGFSIGWMLLPGYVLALVLTAISTEEYVNVAWDSAGVTTGPVTVPLVLAMGLGFGEAVGAIEGFGILAMASICPIVAVLATGLFVQYQIKRRHIATELRSGMEGAGT